MRTVREPMLKTTLMGDEEIEKVRTRSSFCSRFEVNEV